MDVAVNVVLLVVLVVLSIFGVVWILGGRR